MGLGFGAKGRPTSMASMQADKKGKQASARLIQRPDVHLEEQE